MPARAHATPTALEEKSRRALAGREGYIPLEPAEERELSERGRAGDSTATWSLVMANQNFVRTVARRYRRDNVDYEDLVAEGLLGLVDAAERFDPCRGIKFITYGTWWVKRSILRFLRNVEHPVHVPKYKQYEMQEFWRTHGRLAADLGRPPTRDELMEATGITQRELGEFVCLSGGHESLDDERSRAREELSGSWGNAETATIVADARARLQDVLHVLTDREQRVIRHRFGLEGAERMTLAALGEQLGVTKERVRQIENAARGKLLDSIERRPRTAHRRQVLPLPAAA